MYPFGISCTEKIPPMKLPPRCKTSMPESLTPKLLPTKRKKSFDLKPPKAAPPVKEKAYRGRQLPWESRREDFGGIIPVLVREWRVSYQIRKGLTWDSPEFGTEEFARVERLWANAIFKLLQGGETSPRILYAIRQGLDTLSYPVDYPGALLKAYAAIHAGKAQTYGMRNLREHEARNNPEAGAPVRDVPGLTGATCGTVEPTYYEVPIVKPEEVYDEATCRWHHWLNRNFGKPLTDEELGLP